MRRGDLRLRITAAIAVVCLVIVATLGVMLYLASERMEFALVEQLVNEELDFLVERYEANPDYLPETGPNVQYYVARSALEVEQMPVYLRELPAGHHEIDIGGGRGERDVVIRQIGELRFAVVYDIGPYEEREQEFRQLLVLSLAAVMLLALVLGYVLSGILTRQLKLLAQRVATLKPNESYAPLLKDEQDEEVAMLAQAFDQYHDLFLAMIRREQEFTANISHELRTPLTAIRTSCELLAEDPGLSDKSRLRVRFIAQAVNNMTEHARALLFLAREQEFSDKEEFALRECAEDVVSAFRDDLARKGLSCEIAIAPQVMVTANRQALHLALTNLVKNAVMYTDTGFVRLHYAEGALDVTDSGAGIAATDLPHIFERNYRGRNRVEGLGLGLDIVRRICNQAGWTMAVHSAPGSGSTFRLAFG